MAAVVEAFPSREVTIFVTGSLPIYTSVIKGSTVLVNTTNTAVTVQFHEEGNYTCVATNKYGTDLRMFSVIITGRQIFDDNNPSV